MKINVQHTVTEVKNLEVVVDPLGVLQRIYWESTTKPDKAEYISGGYWYVHSYFDYHNGVDKEKKDRLASQDELDLYDAYRKLVEAYQEKEK